jgi:thiamine-phosphate diphosphorylase
MREKDLPPQEMVALARRLSEAIAGRALLVLNGPPEVAAEAGAHGVHLPETAPLVGPVAGLLVGRSVHSVEAALEAEQEGADYLVAGPVYQTASHPEAAPAGITLIRKIAVEVKLPVIAIGGITPERVRAVLRAGASGVAAVRAILESESPRQAAQRLARELEAACLELGVLRR